MDETEGRELTPTEADVMHRSEQGQTRAQITHDLRIGNSTLVKHLAHAFAKLAPGRARSGAFYMLGRRDQKRDDRRKSTGPSSEREPSESTHETAKSGPR